MRANLHIALPYAIAIAPSGCADEATIVTPKAVSTASASHAATSRHSCYSPEVWERRRTGSVAGSLLVRVFDGTTSAEATFDVTVSGSAGECYVY